MILCVKYYYACYHRVNVAHLDLQEFKGKLVLDFQDQK